ncbi:uncharacterized protein LOC143598846 [Bidens hawaiensis]|uniref:uncharacterized protein LOC143598846 n=1 Tax=Bidens hawaiensis TaxID=980011 RepID=UPI004049DE51
MGPFPNSFGNLYFWVAVNYVSKWVEAIATKTNDHIVVCKQRKLNICELEELRDEAYKCASAYKDKMGRVHYAKLRRRTFEEGQRVWLYNSRLKLFPSKFKSKWTGPYQAKRVGKYGEVEIKDFDDHLRQVVNGHRLKPYLEYADLNKEIHESEFCFLGDEPTYSVD